MKKIFLLFFATAFVFSINATTPVTEFPVLNANQIMLPVGNTGKTISLMDFANISVKDFEELTHRKMKIWDKIQFKIGQKKLRNKIEADGTIKSPAVEKYAKAMAADGDSGFHVGGFALGFLLGLIGVLIAYLINDDKKRNRIKWAWIGLGGAILLYILFLI